MAKFYIISPSSVPWNQCLFPVMKPHFYAAGHTFTPNIEDADVVLFDLHTRISPYKEEDIAYLYNNNIPTVTFDEWDRGGMSTDEWPNPLTHQQQDVFNNIFFNNVPAVHFCRLFDKTMERPPNLYPYEKPYSYEEPLLTPDELFNREFDVVFIANDSPSRRRIAYALMNDERLNCFISIGDKKIPTNEFLDLHKQGKLFVSSGAGGFTDERVQLLFSVAGIIRERSNQLLLHDFTHGENCLRVDNPPTTKDLDEIYEVVNNKERLYEIYRTGYDFVKKYYSSEYITNYILSTLKQGGII